MNSKSKFILRLFIVLFTVSVSATVIPSEIINIYGLFGEVKSSTATRENGKNTEEITSVFEKSGIAKGINIYNEWFEIAIIIIFLIFSLYMVKLPKRDTIVTLKVRMNN